MPKSRTRTKKHVRPIGKKDYKNIVEAYYKKIEEYMDLPFDQLNELEKSGKVKGVYAKALTYAISQKTPQMLGGPISPIS